MSSEIHHALELIERHADLADFVGPRDAGLRRLALAIRTANGECPVVTCHDGRFTGPIEEESASFGAFLLARLRDGLG